MPYREPLEVGERGVAGAEVVERDQDPQRVQRPELLGDPPGAAAEKHALGDLDDQPPRPEPGLGERLPDQRA
jgi:hypothetical protein